MKYRWIGWTGLFTVLSGAAHAQVEVDSVVADAQLVKSVLAQAKQYTMQGKQLLTEVQTTEQLVQSYNSFVQNPSLGAALGLMNQAGLSNDLPINPNALAGITSGSAMSLSGLSGILSSLSSLSTTSYNQNHIYTCTDNSWACTQQQQHGYGLAGTSGVAQSAYQDLRNHMPVVQSLRDQAATATTPAQRENLSVAIQSEQVWNDNMLGQINAADMQAKANEATLIQQDNEKINQNIDLTIGEIP